MSPLTLLLLQGGFLVLLWFFVFGVVYSLRADLFGVKVRKLPEPVASASPAPAAPVASPDAVTTQVKRPAAPTPGAASATPPGCGSPAWWTTASSRSPSPTPSPWPTRPRRPVCSPAVTPAASWSSCPDERARAETAVWQTVARTRRRPLPCW